MTLRKIIFWPHLVAGVLASIVVLIMSVTGVLLMYERQINEWANRDYRAEPPSSDKERLPVGILLDKVSDARPDFRPSSVTFRPDPTAPVELGMGRGRRLYANRYTGEVLGEGSEAARSFFRTITNWHRWLGMSGEGRKTGRAITGAFNLSFLFLIVSGFYLWWPKTWTLDSLRRITWFHSGLRGKARDFNWHHVFGFWMAIPLFIIVLSGVVISYPWATALVYRVTGSEPPQRRSRAAAVSKPQPKSKKQNSGENGNNGDDSAHSHSETQPDLDRLLGLVQQEAPSWRSITLRVPEASGQPVSFSVDLSPGGQPAKSFDLTLDSETGEVVSRRTYQDRNPGNRLWIWLRFAHTGEVYGFVGQTIAGLASAAAILLVWTGVALSWRRFFPKRQ